MDENIEEIFREANQYNERGGKKKRKSHPKSATAVDDLFQNKICF